MKGMNGQLTMFDYHQDKEQLKPCEYKFKRYIGQKVELFFYPDKVLRGTIREIEQYYTIIQAEDGEEYVGTPTSVSPIIEGG